MTKKRLYGDIARLGCILCHRLGYGSTPAEIHHIRRLGAVREDSEVLPLCPEHHRGQSGVHGLGRKAFNAKYNLTEEELLVDVENLLNTRKSIASLF